MARKLVAALEQKSKKKKVKKTNVASRHNCIWQTDTKYDKTNHSIAIHKPDALIPVFIKM